MIFRPDKKANFEKCQVARNGGWMAINRKVRGSRERIRFYMKETHSAKALILHFHGNAGSACGRVPLAKRMKEKGIHYVFVEYPGFSKDRKRPTQKRTLANALEVYDFIKRKMNPQNLPLFAHGTSLGSGVATYLAGKRSLAGLILHAPFTSMKEVADHLFKGGGRFVTKYTFMAKDWAPLVLSPVLALHARKDEMIPLRIGEEQQEYFTSTSFLDSLIFETGTHMNIYDRPSYWTAISDFVERVRQKDFSGMD